MIDERPPIKKEYLEFALEAGGSTYPEVNTRQLERFARLIIEECIRICESGTNTQTTGSGAAEMIRQRFGLLTPNQALDIMAADAQALGLYD